MSTETEMKFTPGPWSIVYNEPRPWHPNREPDRIVDADGEPLVVCGVTVTNWGNPEVDANARMIAAAPALYEALRGVAIMLNAELTEYESEPWAQRVRAALALVDGPPNEGE